MIGMKSSILIISELIKSDYMVKNYQLDSLLCGKTMRWVVAWTFLSFDEIHQLKYSKDHIINELNPTLLNVISIE